MAKNESPLELAPDEVEFWKSVFLMHLHRLMNGSLWDAFRFSRPPEPGELADACVRQLRARKGI